MKEKLKKPLADIVGCRKCPNGFCCYDKPHKVLYKPRKSDNDVIIECIKDTPCNCKYSVGFGALTFCKCPLGNHVAKCLATN